ncbi:MAG: 3-isopropylmalate dehydratase [Firmicutes bacterium]|nr:3-isopropylmalate dehydratase [Bacillota bacterium]
MYQGFGKANPETELKFGPNIANWPTIRPLPKNLLLKVASVIHDPVTTTDELIPSGETSSYRSNPFKLAEFTLSRKDPAYVGKAKAIEEQEALRKKAIIENGSFAAVEPTFMPLVEEGLTTAGQLSQTILDTGLGSVIVAIKPGDGSAREQAASCQRVLGGDANIAVEYATKRYRSNVINWGMLPFTIAKDDLEKLTVDDLIFLPDIRQSVQDGATKIQAILITSKGKTSLELKLENLSPEDRDIILSGCLINYYAQ